MHSADDGACRGQTGEKCGDRPAMAVMSDLEPTSQKIHGIAMTHAATFAGIHHPAPPAARRNTRHCANDSTTPPAAPITTDMIRF